MLGFFIVTTVILALYSFVFRPFRRSTAMPKGAGYWARYTAMLAAVVGIIAAAEFLAPSMRLTGLAVPDVQMPPRYMADIPWTDAPLTYADVAGLAPWLWPLGALPRDAVIARIEADLVIAQAQAAQLEQRLSMTPGAADLLSDYRLRSEFYGKNIQAEGLTLALADVRKRFTSPLVEARTADEFVSSRIESVLNERREAMNLKYAELNEQLSEIRAASGEGEITDPAYTALNEQLYRLSDTFMLPSGLDFNFVAPVVGLVEPSAQRAFPKFKSPLIVSHTQETVQPGGVLHAPPPAAAPFTGAGQALADAATGYRRAPDTQLTEQRCGIVITDSATRPTLRQQCEIALPLDIDYDVTGTNCRPGAVAAGSTADLALAGTRIAVEACKESWINPHLVVIFEQDSFTVHAPRPVGPDGAPVSPAPLSQWYATWGGTEMPLSPTARFPWDGTADVVSELTLRHDLQPQVTFGRRWEEFRGDISDIQASLMMLRGMTEDSTPTMPVTIDGLSLFPVTPLAQIFAALGGAPPQAPPAESANAREAERLALKAALSRQYVFLGRVSLELRAALSGTNPQSVAIERLACSHDTATGYLALQPGVATQDESEITAMGVSTCAAMKAYGAILTSVERGLSEGSWIWMVERPRY
jgi:hypothetical protein